MAQVRDDGGVRHVLPSGREITLPSSSRPDRHRSLRPWVVLIAAIAVVDLIGLAVVGSNGDDQPAARTSPTPASTPPPTSSPPITSAASTSSASSTSTAPISTAPISTAATPTSIEHSASPAPVVLATSTPAICTISDGSIVPPASGLCIWAGGANPGANAGTTTVISTRDYALKAGAIVELAGRDWRITSVHERGRAEGIDPAAFAGKSGRRRLYMITSGATSDQYARALPAQ